ncbi:MAG TPA: hypothetical protein VGM88_05890 [Kofleriaceae bacterium]|jgi:hypothetical protein
MNKLLLALALLTGACVGPSTGIEPVFVTNHHGYTHVAWVPYDNGPTVLQSSALCPGCGPIEGTEEGPPPEDTIIPEGEDPAVGELPHNTAYSATFQSQPGAEPAVPHAPAVPQAIDAETP